MKNLQAEADRWWRQALNDFEFLPKIRQLNKYDTCCFFAQQTTEKALKAFLFKMGEELVLTHSIFKLCEMAVKYDSRFTNLREEIKILDFYYVEARYPNAVEDAIPAEFYSDADAEKAISMAEHTLEEIRPFFLPT